ncbi:L-2-amino-thiazoline-4-carboxylic acid hydrolase [Nocardia iowensis]|uniref:L-2-amino-thiazoline-4-carboxylic acid hydrolase n=1 Tax=Nocardia iowensis TaxID=204891 RepID=A0ABX8S1Q5_NOCIO|nr:L-2-amino-thiazoline-4-carboxylic acid hydrolase [Nocardia iowensis]QXN95142.1 L-2-amino-thiazoline-4-carboxylic acid hydrolase [Nocardia iowensis]
MNTDPFNLADGEYVPDVAADSAAIVEAFFDHLATSLRDRDLPDEMFTGMRGALVELEAANADRLVDEAARYNLRMTLALVVAYRAVRPLLGTDATMAALRAAFVEPLGDLVQSGTRAMLDASDDPFAAMVAVSKTREEHSFGAGFTFVRAADDDRSYHVDVVRCFYHDVLVANSASELTPVMCEFDANWIDAIDPAKHGFRFHRATTIGLGGSHCPFHWDRTES